MDPFKIVEMASIIALSAAALFILYRLLILMERDNKPCWKCTRREEEAEKARQESLGRMRILR
jgi:hypothetical protein